MRKIIGLAAAAVLILYGLIACGIVPHAEASAPMAQDPSQVRATLTALPEDLHSVTLLARTTSLVLRASNEGNVSTYEYRPASGAYRRLTVPLDGEWKIGAMAASPDGCLWTVFHGEKGSVLMKTSQGNVLIQRELEDFSPETILCDSVGHVFAATTEEVRRYSPEGELQETMVIPEQDVKELRLASRQDRLFLRMKCAGKRAVYWKLQADMTLGDSFEACV